MGEELNVLVGSQPHRYRKGAVGDLAISNFVVLLLFMCTPFVAELPNLTCGEGRVSWGLQRLISQEIKLTFQQWHSVARTGMPRFRR